jgi:hypothetical protein
MNDHAYTGFYDALGLNTTQFNRHVIQATNNSIERVFPEVGEGAWGGWLAGWLGFGWACGWVWSDGAARSEPCCLMSACIPASTL